MVTTRRPEQYRGRASHVDICAVTVQSFRGKQGADQSNIEEWRGGAMLVNGKAVVVIEAGVSRQRSRLVHCEHVR